ncbi:TetR/AcrR family transcriptional regulator [Microterricola viridarii]|uniref:DNA-binding transcriptional regulator, AcrR family n=1 Tax=Microterricola viridarii TaxID=412690 RepID=A0A1H1WLL3_9MICO|nr:TetR/AcrR family transcriptional regulator [Microterricola viridarii]SDS97521.1 DNA-binding transcriptional regulator, AcrR family [Microterricola viridarii]
MPTPERTSREAIVATGRELLERDGLTGLTMQAIADRVGVKAPSLYKRVRNRDELIRLIAEATVVDLGEHLRAAAAAPTDAAARVAAVALAFRAFAHRFPAGYHLIFAPGSSATRPSHDAILASSAPILEVADALAGPAHALDAARTLTAWANGFISMELADAFQLGGDVDEAFVFGIRALTGALQLRDDVQAVG